MAYQPNPAVSFSDSASLDAFQRLRTSSPFTQFDWTNQYSPATAANQQQWDVAVVGSGAVNVQANKCLVRLTTGGTTSTWAATYQTKHHLIYQPGKSRFVAMTFVLGATATNSTFEIGYAGVNDGILFQRVTGASTTTNYITRRTFTSGSIVDNQVAQSSWNLDKLDGTGASGRTISFLTTNILIIDLQFLGVGRVRVGFDIDGEVFYAHEFLNANVLTLPYMSTGSLPLRAKVINTGTSAGTLTADFICATVISEGGIEGSRANQFSASNGIVQITTGTSLLPIISIRPATTFNSNTFRGHILPVSSECIVGTNTHEYQIIHNATLGGGTSWAAVDSTYSAAEVDIASTTISGGIVVDRGYITAGGLGASAFRTVGDANLFSDSPLTYTSLNNTQETLTLAARTQTGAGVALASFTWQERY